jgi:fimbrial isopeptide formation D2 family protein/uncharacterized repeat protein (TIGR01451 family)
MRAVFLLGESPERNFPMKTYGKMKRETKRIIAAAMAFAILFTLGFPITAFAAISPLPSDNVAQGGAAENTFVSDRGQYSTWESPSSGFSVNPSYAYRFKQSDATFTPFGKRDSTGGSKAAVDHGYPDTSSDDYFMFPVGAGDNSKGEIGFKATDLKIRNPNTGTFDKVDMLVTVTDWTLVSGSKQQYVFLEKHSRTDVLLCDVKEIKLKVEYFAAGTDTKYNVRGNLTYNDIDNKQYIGFRANDADYLYADKKSQLSYAKVDSHYVFYAENHDSNDQSGTPELAAGITYRTNTLDLIFGTNENFSDSSSWSYFGQYSYSMANIDPGAPVKHVSDSDEKEVFSNRLKATAESFTYDIVQPIPAGLSDNMFYSVFRFEDQIDTCLEIGSVTISQESHGDRTDWFEIQTSGNKVTATAKASALANDDFYGGAKRNDTEFTMKVKVKIDPDKSAQLHTHGGGTGHYNAAGDLLTFTNKASTTIRNNVSAYTQETNAVTTKVALPGKKVSDSDESNVDSDKLTNANEPFVYSVRQAILGGMDGADMKYKSFQISDRIDTCVKIEDIKVIKDGGADATSLFDVARAGNDIAVSAKTAALNDASFYGNGSGTGYTLTITASLEQSKTAAELKAHGHYNPAENELTFSNKATVTIDDNGMSTNEVTTKVGVPDLEITKAVNRYEHQVNDRVRYTLTVKHTAKSTSDATSVIIKDVSLPNGFTLDPKSLAVSGIASEKRSFETVGGGFTFKADAIAKNETAVITFEAIPDKSQNGTIMNNTASVTAYSMTEEKKSSVSVYINSPKLELLKTANKNEYKVGDTISYRLTLTQRNPGTFMRDIIIGDSLTQSGVTLIPGSVQVMNSENKIITHLCDITVSGNAFTVLTRLDMGYADRAIPPKTAGITPYSSVAPEKQIIVTYDVSVNDQSLSGLAVKNTAIAPTRPNTYGDLIKDDPDIPSGGDKKENLVPIVGAKLKIDKNSDKSVYDVSDTAKYTLKISQIREDYTAKNVVVKDTFDTTLAAILEGSIKVTRNKMDITSGCAITVSGSAFEIATNSDLAWGDDLAVTYSVKFDPAAKGKLISNTAITHADNADEAEDENTVGVEPGVAVIEIVKASDKQTYKVGDTAKYTLDVSTISSEPAINVIVKDKLDTTGASIVAGSIKVMFSGEDITSGCAIAADTQGFAIETGKTLSEGESLFVTYDVLIEDPKLAEQDIKNIAIASSSNSEDAEDENIINIESSEAALKIEKTSDKQTYKVGDTAKYTLNVSNVSSVPAIGVIISDRLDTEGAAIDANSIKVLLADEDITSDCIIAATDQDFMIETGKNLNDDEKIVVTYDVLIESEDLEGKDVENIALATASNSGEAEDDHVVSVPEKETPDDGKDTPERPNDDGNFGSPKTGDNFDPFAIVILALGIAGIIAAIIYRRRTRIK